MVCILIVLLCFNVSVYAASIEISPANPTIEDEIIIHISEWRSSGCIESDSTQSSAHSNTFDYNIWINNFDATCDAVFEFRLVNTVGPLAEGTYTIRTTWDWSYYNRTMDSLFGEPFIVEKQFKVTGPLDIGEQARSGLPHTFTLAQNYPNPFNSGTTIEFHLREPADIDLTIYNSLGRRVWKTGLRRLPHGAHTILFDAKDEAGDPLPSGIYYYRLQVGEQILTKRMVLQK